MKRSQNTPWHLGLCLSAALIGVAALTSCAGRGETASAVAQTPPDRGSIDIPENQLPNFQITPAQTMHWTVSLRASGTVDWDADHTTQAIAQVSGPIAKILVDTGSQVEANAPLLQVSSPDVTNAIATYRKARNRFDYETRWLARSRDLLEHKAIAQKDLENAEADYNDAATDLQNALQALVIFGLSAKEIDDPDPIGINPVLAVRSPIRGTVVQKLVYPGQIVQAGATICFLISDPSTVWIQGHIYDKDLPNVHTGDSVDVSHPSIPGVVHGTVSNIGAMLDPATRTTPVRITVPNPGRLLKKDLFVDLLIHTRSQRKVLAVPASAVLYDANNLPFLYVELAPGKFAQRAITTGVQAESQFEILAGLKPGDRIVSSGALFLQFANTSQK